MVPLLSVGLYSPVGPGDLTASFFALTPTRVLDAVEVGGLRSTGRCLPLRAFENRVYEVELEDERRLVVKFHRPGRWSRAAILDRKSTRLNSSHLVISYAVFCLKKKKKTNAKY